MVKSQSPVYKVPLNIQPQVQQQIHQKIQEQVLQLQHQIQQNQQHQIQQHQIQQHQIQNQQLVPQANHQLPTQQLTNPPQNVAVAQTNHQVTNRQLANPPNVVVPQANPHVTQTSQQLTSNPQQLAVAQSAQQMTNQQLNIPNSNSQADMNKYYNNMKNSKKPYLTIKMKGPMNLKSLLPDPFNLFDDSDRYLNFSCLCGTIKMHERHILKNIDPELNSSKYKNKFQNE